MSEWSPSDDTGWSVITPFRRRRLSINGSGSLPAESLKDMLIADQIVGPSSIIEVESSAAGNW